MKTYQYLITTILLIVSCAIYAGYDYFIKFQNLSNSTITIIPVYHYCVYAFSNKAIIIAIGHTGDIKIRANNSGACAFYDAYEQFNFSSSKKSKGWIKFYLAGGSNDSGTNSSGTIFDDGDYGQDFKARWTFYSDSTETTTVTFW